MQKVRPRVGVPIGKRLRKWFVLHREYDLTRGGHLQYAGPDRPTHQGPFVYHQANRSPDIVADVITANRRPDEPTNATPHIPVAHMGSLG